MAMRGPTLFRRRADITRTDSVPASLTTADGRPARVAIILDGLGPTSEFETSGSELLACFPHAQLFAPFADDHHRRFWSEVAGPVSVASTPGGGGPTRRAVDLAQAWTPDRWDELDLSPFDLIISNSFGSAHWIDVPETAFHVCYAHGGPWFGGVARRRPRREGRWASMLLDRRSMKADTNRDRRALDLVASYGIDAFIADSKATRRLVEQRYRRPASVVYPACTSLPRAERTAQAGMQKPRKTVFVVATEEGDWRQRPLLDVLALVPGAEFRLLVGQKGQLLAPDGFDVHMVHAGTIAAMSSALAEADAMISLETTGFAHQAATAQSAGLPVIGLDSPVMREILQPLGNNGATGCLFADLDVGAIADAIGTFERYRTTITPEACSANADRFGADRFRRTFVAQLRMLWDQHLMAQAPFPRPAPERRETSGDPPSSDDRAAASTPGQDNAGEILAEAPLAREDASQS
ncbi:MAG: hypothetical protein ACFB6S_17340 [Geminicoccaceae bacterium]